MCVCVYIYIYIFCLFRDAPAANGGSQAGGQIGAAAAGLHHSHSSGRIQATSATYTTAHGNVGSYSLSGARDRTYVLMDTSWACYR